MPNALFEAKADSMDGGLNLNTDRLLKPEQISAGEALRFERGSGLMTGPGYRLSATPVANVNVGGLTESSIVTAAIWGKFGTKLQFSIDAVTFYDIGLTLTTGERTAMLEGPDGDMFYTNQIDSPGRIAVALTTVLVNDTDITITVGTVNITKFAASGTVYIRGDAITYSGVNAGAGTLTGVAGIQSGGHPLSSIVTQTSNPGNFTDKGNILALFQNNDSAIMLVAGSLSSPSKVAWSGPFSFTHPEYLYDFSSGNGGGSDFMPGKVTGIIIGTAAGYVIQEHHVSKITGIDATTGGLTFLVINNQYGAYNPGCVVDMDGVVGFMGCRRFMPIVLAITPQAQPISQLDENFDLPLRPWFESHDDADQQATAFVKWDSTSKILKMGAVVNGELQCQIHDRHLGRFLGKEQRKVGAASMFKGASYFGHLDNGNLYLDDIGRTNDGVVISHTMSTGRIEYDRGRKWMKAKEFRHDGWMTRGTVFTLRIYVNGSDTPAFDEDFDDTLIVDNAGRSIGLRGVGLSVPGGSSAEGVTVYQFVNPLVLRGLNGEDFRFEWEISSEGGFLLNNTWYLSAFVPPRSPRTRA